MITDQGMNRTTGAAIDGIDHLRQSITDILTTPVGSRVMRREYGSSLFRLLDQPLNQGTLVQLYAATVEALSRWEPRLNITRVAANDARAAAGHLDLTIEGSYRGTPVTLSGLPITTGS
ncbi:GPW/gp25 family protein [Guyparkeria sp. GHLCS8-2]|uniref:GPW/gp25 family protein n=1 Tax=Guyparkeria halopsychrophila TaxID=3139421 RepID=UPI0037CAE94F